jgi:hypothetical protein
MGKTLKNQSSIREEIKGRVISGIPCHSEAQNLSFSLLLSKNLKVKTHRTTVLLVVFYDCKTWSIISWQSHGLRLFERRALRGILGSKRDKMKGSWIKLHNEESQNLYWSPNIY